MTKVINLLGGPGCGKSTTAAGLFFKLKEEGKSVELVREYVKNWAWEGKQIVQYDQVYICAKQMRLERLLFNKVDYIITDSPIILSSFYNDMYFKSKSLDPIIDEFHENAKADNVEHLFFMLDRTKKYDPSGRYQTEDQAKDIDTCVKKFLDDNNIDYEKILGDHREKVENLYNIIRNRGSLSK